MVRARSRERMLLVRWMWRASRNTCSGDAEIGNETVEQSNSSNVKHDLDRRISQTASSIYLWMNEVKIDFQSPLPAWMKMAGESFDDVVVILHKFSLRLRDFFDRFFFFFFSFFTCPLLRCWSWIVLMERVLYTLKLESLNLLPSFT